MDVLAGLYSRSEGFVFDVKAAQLTPLRHNACRNRADSAFLVSTCQKSKPFVVAFRWSPQRNRI
jgi:hypothetical protein